MAPQAAIIKKRAEPKGRERHYQVSPKTLIFFPATFPGTPFHTCKLTQGVTHVIYGIIAVNKRNNWKKSS